MENKRTIEEIQREYGQLCAKAGNAQYQVATIQKEIDLINDRLRDLNLEAAAVQAAEAKAAQEAAKVEEEVKS